jgi:3-oxoacyl-[acyl-carrier protein] reductase
VTIEIDLSGRVALVTGSSRGLGRADALALARAGADVVLADIQLESDSGADAEAYGPLARAARAEGLVYTEQTAEEIRSLGRRALAVRCDVTERADVDAAVERARGEVGPVDILVANAGTLDHVARFEEQSPELWERDLRVNLTGVFNCAQAIWPGMVERGWGRIVNVCSTAGKRPSANMPEYSVAKAAELSLSRLFADRYAAQGVLVNAICPGPTGSELWLGPGGLADQSRDLSGLESREEALEAAGSRRPINRLAEVGEIAGAIVFLCSERASYVAGAAWSVDGGTVQVII